MPVRYEIDHERRVVLGWVTGVLDDAEVMAYGKDLRADPEFDPEYSQLTVVEASAEHVSTNAFRRLAMRPPLFSPKSRRALVAPTKLEFGLARMFELLLGGKEGDYRVFYSREEAEAWLDVDKPDPPL